MAVIPPLAFDDLVRVTSEHSYSDIRNDGPVTFQLQGGLLPNVEALVYRADGSYLAALAYCRNDPFADIEVAFPHSGLDGGLVGETVIYKWSDPPEAGYVAASGLLLYANLLRQDSLQHRSTRLVRPARRWEFCQEAFVRLFDKANSRAPKDPAAS